METQRDEERRASQATVCAETLSVAAARPALSGNNRKNLRRPRPQGAVGPEVPSIEPFYFKNPSSISRTSFAATIGVCSVGSYAGATSTKSAPTTFAPLFAIA